MDLADLHIHTTASDGLFSPGEVVKWAKRKNLKAIAITDHDTINGIEEAKSTAIQCNIEIISGIELNSIYNNEDIHILGYFIDYTNKSLLEILNRIQNDRYLRAEKMVSKLQDFGLKITFNEVLVHAKGQSVGRPHIARALISKGYIKTTDQAFTHYIGKGCPGYVERFKLTPKEACDIIKNSGGVPVLAHPGLIKNNDIINNLIIDKDIMALEVYHSKHSSSQSKEYLRLAINNNLAITGGSDCHGVLQKDNLPILGNFTVDYIQVLELRKLLMEKG